MIDLSARRPASGHQPPSYRIVGIGSGGISTLDRMALDGASPASLIAVHTNRQLLNASVAGEKLQLGADTTRGLGSGGDPDLGLAAAEESRSQLARTVEGHDLVLLLGGLGGGTASAALPIAAREAREAGAMVIAIVTLPFTFEGKRRVEQAQQALRTLESEVDLLLCFENDQMGDRVSPTAGIAHAFVAADQTLGQAVHALIGLLAGEGLIHLGLDHLRTVLPGIHARALFAHGFAEGSNRPYDALTQALRNPLVEKGRVLRDCDTVLVQVTGGPDMTLHEVHLLMEELNRHIAPHTHLLFGTSVAPHLAGKLSVTLFASIQVKAEEIKEVTPFTIVEPAAPARLPAVVDESAIEAADDLEELQEKADIPPPPPEPSKVALPPEDLFSASYAVTSEPELEPEREMEPSAVEVAPIAEPAEDFAEDPIEELATAEAPPATVEEAEPELPAEPAAELVEEPLEEPQDASLNEEPDEEPTEEPEQEPLLEEPAPLPEPPREAQPDPRPAAEPAPSAEATPAAAPASGKPPTQGTLKFESTARGRFEKSEPTIVDGEDLDIPTYLRRNVRIRV